MATTSACSLAVPIGTIMFAFHRDRAVGFSKRAQSRATKGQAMADFEFMPPPFQSFLLFSYKLFWLSPATGSGLSRRGKYFLIESWGVLLPWRKAEKEFYHLCAHVINALLEVYVCSFLPASSHWVVIFSLWLPIKLNSSTTACLSFWFKTH